MSTGTVELDAADAEPAPTVSTPRTATRPASSPANRFRMGCNPLSRNDSDEKDDPPHHHPLTWGRIRIFGQPPGHSGPRRHLQLAEDAGHVVLHGSWADRELVGDLLVGAPGRDQARDL